MFGWHGNTFRNGINAWQHALSNSLWPNGTPFSCNMRALNWGWQHQSFEKHLIWMSCREYSKAHQHQTMSPSASHKPREIYELCYNVKSGFSRLYLSQVNNMYWSGNAYQLPITTSLSPLLTDGCMEKTALSSTGQIIIKDMTNTYPYSLDY